MIPTPDMICDLWQVAAREADTPEPYLFATERADHPDQVVTATYMEGEDGGATTRVAFHLWQAGDVSEPTWVALASPAFHADMPAEEYQALQHGELERRFAAGDERVHDVLIVHVVSLDGARTRLYTQPMLEPHAAVIVNSPSDAVEMLSNLLVAMHRPVESG